jgi:hypothetical protein
MARANLSDLLDLHHDSIDRPTTPTAYSAATGQDDHDNLGESSPRRNQGRRPRPTGPAYLEFERKETRLRPDQLSDLTEHARRLNRMKGTGGQRITENTLIRIAVDLLLADIDRADGSTEERIRRSLEY